VKITGIRFERAVMQLDPPFCPNWDPTPRRSFGATLTIVETDGGVTGYGAGDDMGGLEGYEKYFIGKDLFNIQEHVRTLETITFHAGRYWPVEAAIWDAIGKALNTTVATLFGGAQKSIPAYASTGAVMTAKERAKSAAAIRAAGFKAMKIRVPQSDLNLGIATLKAIREEVGNDLELMVDLNQAWRMPGDIRKSLDLTSAMRFIDAAADYGVYWVEEPLPMEDIDGLKRLRGRGVRIAGGEMMRTLPEIISLIENNALDVVQADVVLAAGMERSRVIAGMCAHKNIIFTPHTWSNGYGLAANLHVTAGLGGAPFIEYPFDPPTWSEDRRDFLMEKPLLTDSDGLLHVPDGPGLGIAPNWIHFKKSVA
jgi:L-alanine-DL-glutamate epimerase-like enolase superfamily enzyme